SAPQPPAPQTRTPAAMPHVALPPITPAAIEKAKAEARSMLADLARLGTACAPGDGLTALHLHPDPGAKLSASITAAFAAMKSERPAPNPPR
ncbi:MAG TPA: hypothetical protein VGF36_08010, partial [Rhodopila sp.]